MSSSGLENVGLSPARRILKELKMRGPQTSAKLGRTLGVTGEAARLQLIRLAEQGLVESKPEARGVGRPSLVWGLTAQGQDQFPDAHEELAVQLIEHIRSSLGSDALHRVIATRDEKLRAGYRAELKHASSLRERVRLLAGIRSREGYMCEWRADGDGFLLIENHCPICAAATVCQGFCETELATFKTVLGPDVEVAREEHLMQGDRRCVYRITAGSRHRQKRPSSKS